MHCANNGLDTHEDIAVLLIGNQADLVARCVGRRATLVLAARSPSTAVRTWMLGHWVRAGTRC